MYLLTAQLKPFARITLEAGIHQAYLGLYAGSSFSKFPYLLWGRKSIKLLLVLFAFEAGLVNTVSCALICAAKKAKSVSKIVFIKVAVMIQAASVP
jgi:hypothetical protein